MMPLASPRAPKRESRRLGVPVAARVADVTIAGCPPAPTTFTSTHINACLARSGPQHSHPTLPPLER